MPDDDKFSTGSVARRGAGMLRAFQEWIERRWKCTTAPNHCCRPDYAYVSTQWLLLWFISALAAPLVLSDIGLGVSAGRVTVFEIEGERITCRKARNRSWLMRISQPIGYWVWVRAMLAWETASSHLCSIERRSQATALDQRRRCAPKGFLTERCRVSICSEIKTWRGGAIGDDGIIDQSAGPSSKSGIVLRRFHSYMRVQHPGC